MFDIIPNENEEEEISQRSSAQRLAAKKKRRVLDTFMEELQQKEQKPLHPAKAVTIIETNEKAATTTNIRVGNLNPDTDEITLCRAFVQYGPIASVKIMWPRTAEEFGRDHNSGFVCFMDREHAAQALAEMNGKKVDGHALELEWGKRLPLPPKPIFVLEECDLERESATGHPFNAKSANGSESLSDDILEIQVERPPDHRTVRLIHWTVEHVIRYGAAFERVLIDRTSDDSKFKFLTDHTMPEHVYYRWRMYSLLCGDTKRRWRDQMFFMYNEGPIWIPPRHKTTRDGALKYQNQGQWLRRDEEDYREADLTIGDYVCKAEADKHPDGLWDSLSQKDCDRLKRKVQQITTLERGTIAKAMVCAIDYAYAAEDVADIICSSFVDANDEQVQQSTSSTLINLARLYLVSDILHNCSVPVPNAWKLRQELEQRLEPTFAGLANVYKGIAIEAKADQFRAQVLAVLAVWESWMVFPVNTLGKLAATFAK